MSCRPYRAAGNTGGSPESLPPAEEPAAFICRRVRELMWQRASILRSSEGLESAMSAIDSLALLADARCNPAACRNAAQLKAFLKAHQYVDLSRALLIAMLERRESRGSHYREDAPSPDDAHYLHRISVGLEENRYTVQKLGLPPGAF